MKILIACDSYKGSLSAEQVVSCITEGIHSVDEKFDVIQVPVADGGEGTVEAFCHAVPGQKRHMTAHGPLMEPVKASYAILNNGTAVMEMAETSGLTLISEEQRNPLLTTTYGTGEVLREIMEQGCHHIIIGIGGSATNDGGVGMAQALGVVFRDENGNRLPEGLGGGELYRIREIDMSGLDARLKNTQITIACDVTNPLCGEQGATFVYGPQKGADAQMLETLESGMRHFAQLIKKQFGREFGEIPGAGAAGGLGAGLMFFCGAGMNSGIDLLLDTVKIEKLVEEVDLVITGEGKIDGQSMCGKVPVGVARRVKAVRNVPVIALVGSIGTGAEKVYNCGIDAIFSIVPGPTALEDAMINGKEYLRDAAARVTRLVKVLS